LRSDRLISPHPLYWELGNTPFAREAAYARLVQEGLSATQQQELTDSVLKGWALGSPAFIEELQKKTDRRLSKARAGRPATR
jgi:putative transposase